MTADGRPPMPPADAPPASWADQYDRQAARCRAAALEARAAGRPGRALLHEQHAAAWRDLARNARRETP